jgi:hypothetical protein
VTQYEQTIGGFPVTIKVKDMAEPNTRDDRADWLADLELGPPEAIVERIAAALGRGERHGGIMVHELDLLFTWSLTDGSAKG